MKSNNKYASQKRSCRNQLRRLSVCFISASMVLFTAGCATPSQLSKMPPDELKKVSNQSLCEAYAVLYRKQTDIQNIKTEMNRRKADCSLEIEIQNNTNDCSSLKIVKINPNSTYSNVTDVTVINTSNRAKTFRIHDSNGIYGNTQHLPPNTSSTYKIATDEKTKSNAALASALGANALSQRSAWGLFECFTTR